VLQETSAISPRRWYRALSRRLRRANLRHDKQFNKEDMTMNTKSGVRIGLWMVAAGVMAFFLASATPYARAQRDRGVNQPGAAGNHGRDPGLNQPGAAGNHGRDPGLNQPGAAGNHGAGVGGSARQTRVVGDPGINQPGRAGNRR
jgi:hypothetical protein